MLMTNCVALGLYTFVNVCSHTYVYSAANSILATSWKTSLLLMVTTSRHLVTSFFCDINRCTQGMEHSIIRESEDAYIPYMPHILICTARQRIVAEIGGTRG